MSYQVRRVDPYWLTHPVLPAMIVGGTVLGLAGVVSQKDPLVWIGGALVSLGVLLAAKIVVSAVLAVLGVLGGVIQFAILPNIQTVGWPLHWKVLTGVVFGLTYMVLMDALVLAIAVLYNLFAALTRGVRLEIEEEAEGD